MPTSRMTCINSLSINRLLMKFLGCYTSRCFYAHCSMKWCFVFCYWTIMMWDLSKFNIAGSMDAIGTPLATENTSQCLQYEDSLLRSNFDEFVMSPSITRHRPSSTLTRAPSHDTLYSHRIDSFPVTIRSFQ